MKLFLYLEKIRNENQFNIYDLIFIYMFGGLLGTIYEEIYYLVISNKFIPVKSLAFGLSF